ncbi:MAG: LysE family transporter [Alteromonadaceae bacterium]|nr:LysE family transporter [Alteromonadaceae bacterium]
MFSVNLHEFKPKQALDCINLNMIIHKYELLPGLIGATLKYLGAAYLIYLAIKIAFGPNKTAQHKEPELLNFKQGIFLQFINPKSMMMVLSCITAFSLPGDLYTFSVIQAFIVFTFIGTFSNTGWLLFGVAINRLLSTEKSQLIFNRSLAVLTLVAVALLFS